jgi:hypothetical protein
MANPAAGSILIGTVFNRQFGGGPVSMTTRWWADPVTGWLGSQAQSSAGSMFDSTMRELWSFALSLLGWAFKLTDELSVPNLDPRTGPLHAVLPITAYVAAAVAAVMLFAQIGQAVLRGGRGLGRVLIGAAQYVLVCSLGMGVWQLLVQASDALGLLILQQGLHVKSWSALATGLPGLTKASDAASSVGLGLTALFCLIPAALGMIVEGLVREGAVLVLAATIPILAAGQVSEATESWLWTGLRWILALTFLPPAGALVLTIGVGTARAAAQSTATTAMGTAHDTLTALVMGIMMLISLVCPMAMFKLMAFISPSSLSGSSLRSWYGSGSADAGGGAGGGAGGSTEDAADGDTDGRFASTASDAVTTTALDPGGLPSSGEQTAGQAAGPLDAVGAGNPGGPTPSGPTAGGGGHGGQDEGWDEDPEEDAGEDEAAGDESGEMAEAAEVAEVAL